MIYWVLLVSYMYVNHINLTDMSIVGQEYVRPTATAGHNLDLPASESWKASRVKICAENCIIVRDLTNGQILRASLSKGKIFVCGLVTQQLGTVYPAAGTNIFILT